MAAPFSQAITFFYTADLAATADFYERVLGLPLALDQGACRIYRASPGGYVGFCQHLNPPAQPNAAILTLVTIDVDGWAARLVEKGIVFEKPPMLNPKFNIYHCFLRDPNGLLIEIQRFEDPRWQEDG